MHSGVSSAADSCCSQGGCLQCSAKHWIWQPTGLTHHSSRAHGKRLTHPCLQGTAAIAELGCLCPVISTFIMQQPDSCACFAASSCHEQVIRLPVLPAGLHHQPRRVHECTLACREAAAFARVLCLGLCPHLRCAAVCHPLSHPCLQGAAAIAEVLFGDVSPSGRLPVTFYHNNFTQQSLMSSMDMRAWPGRTYRFLQVSPGARLGAAQSSSISGMSACSAMSIGRSSGLQLLEVMLPPRSKSQRPACWACVACRSNSSQGNCLCVSSQLC